MLTATSSDIIKNSSTDHEITEIDLDGNDRIGRIYVVTVFNDSMKTTPNTNRVVRDDTLINNLDIILRLR